MTVAADVGVIGIGNPYRRDDGVGPAVAAAVAALGRRGVRVVTCAAEPTAILDAWAGATLAVVVDAAAGGTPGRVLVGTLEDFAEPVVVSSHDLSVRQTYELAAALPAAVRAVLSVIGDRALQPAEKTVYQQL